MPMTLVQRGLALITVGVGLVLTFVAGLFVYVNVTAKPLHPDPLKIPSAALSPPAPKWAGAVEQSRLSVRAAVANQNLPGVSVAVGAGGEIVWAEGFGVADIEKQSAVTPATRFRAGDASIPLTSAGVG